VTRFLLGWSAASALVWLVAYCVANDRRFRRFLVLLLIVFVMAAGWLAARGGMPTVIHDYREITGRPGPLRCRHGHQ
jgi:hypothetical protein